MAYKAAVVAVMVGLALAAPQYGYEPPQEPSSLYETPAETVQQPVQLYEIPDETVQQPVQLYEIPDETVQEPVQLYETPAETVQEPVQLYETPAETVQEPVQVYEPPSDGDLVGEPQELVPDVVDPPQMEGMPYAFQWLVEDQESSNAFNHVESSDGRTTQGEYRVLLPDGRTQVVKFYDNGSGYNAEVSYEK